MLTMPQVAAVKERLDGWVAKVGSAALTMESEAVGIVEPMGA